MAEKSGFDLITLPPPGWTLVHADEHRRQFARDVYGDDYSSRMIVVHQNEALEGVDLSDLAGIKELVQNIATQAKQIMVSAEVLPVGGVPSLWYILKQSQAPSGMAYSGSLVLPLAGQFFTIQLMCLETGITGIRESIVVDKLLEQGVSFKVLADANSYCESGTALAPYSADGEIYDERFPNHPLSRVRRYIAEVLQMLSSQNLSVLVLLVVFWLSLVVPPAVRANPSREVRAAAKAAGANDDQEAGSDEGLSPLNRQLKRARRLIAQGHNDRALLVLKVVLDKYPKCAEALFLTGTCHQDLGVMDAGDNEAKSYYLKAIAIDPNYSHAYRKLAELQGLEGNFAEQVKLATRAIAGQPPDILAYRTRAIAYSNLHKDKEALVDIRKFFELHKVFNKYPDYVLKATMEQNAGCDKEAVETFEAARKITPNGDLLVQETKSLMKLGKAAQALKMLDDYLKPANDFGPALTQKAAIHIALGQIQEALKVCDRLVEVEPTTRALQLRASVLDKLGQKARADADRRRAASL